MEDNMFIFSQRLKQQREANRYSQAYMAQFLNISQSYYSRFETDQAEPSYENLVKIAALFEVTTDYLLGVTDTTEKSVSESLVADLEERLTALEKAVGINRNK